MTNHFFAFANNKSYGRTRYQGYITRSLPSVAIVYSRGVLLNNTCNEVVIFSGITFDSGS